LQSLSLDTHENPYFDLLSKECAKYGFDADLISAQIFCESSYRPYLESHVGARGLMQIMPATAEWLGVDPDALWYPEVNIKIGVGYDKWCWDRFDNTWLSSSWHLRWVHTFAAYHDGIGNVRKFRKRMLPCKFTKWGTLYYFRIWRKYYGLVRDE